MLTGKGQNYYSIFCANLIEGIRGMRSVETTINQVVARLRRRWLVGGAAFLEFGLPFGFDFRECRPRNCNLVIADRGVGGGLGGGWFLPKFTPLNRDGRRRPAYTS